MAAAAIIAMMATACTSEAVERPYADDPRRVDALEYFEAELASEVTEDLRPRYRCAIEAVIDIGGPDRFLGLVDDDAELGEPSGAMLTDLKAAYGKCGAKGLMVALFSGSGFGPGFSAAEPTIDRDYVACVEQGLGGDIDAVVDYYLGLADEVTSDQRDKVFALSACES